MHSTGLRVVGAWLFAIVLILFSTVFVHVPYTREIQMVLAIPVLLFFGAPFYAGAWKGTRSGRNNIDLRGEKRNVSICGRPEND
jgi:Cu2+-exporting ATPase